MYIVCENRMKCGFRLQERMNPTKICHYDNSDDWHCEVRVIWLALLPDTEWSRKDHLGEGSVVNSYGVNPSSRFLPLPPGLGRLRMRWRNIYESTEWRSVLKKHQSKEQWIGSGYDEVRRRQRRLSFSYTVSSGNGWSHRTVAALATDHWKSSKVKFYNVIK